MQLVVTLELQFHEVIQRNDHVQSVASPETFVHHRDDLSPFDDLAVVRPDVVVRFPVHLKVKFGCFVTTCA